MIEIGARVRCLKGFRVEDEEENVYHVHPGQLGTLLERYPQSDVKVQFDGVPFTTWTWENEVIEHVTRFDIILGRV